MTQAAGGFVLLPFDEPVDQDMLDLQNNSGMAIRVRWETLEPTKGNRNPAYLNLHIAAAKAAGKKLTVYFGHHIPSWLLPDILTFVSDPDEIPVGWDRTLLNAWKDFIAWAGQQWALEDTIVGVRGATEILTFGWGLPSADEDGKGWSTYGYKLGLNRRHPLLEAMKETIDAMAAAFPHTQQFLEVAPVAFEKATTKLPDMYVGEAAANYAIDKGYNVMVWRENLDAGVPAYPPTTAGQWKTVAKFTAKETPTGSQMKWNVQDLDTEHRMNPDSLTPNTKRFVMRTAIQIGLDYGMRYFEIYRADYEDTAATALAALLKRTDKYLRSLAA